MMVGPGPLERVVSEQWATRTAVAHRTLTANDTVQVLAQNDPNRLALYVVNRGAQPVAIWLRADMTYSQGFLLAANGGWVGFTVRDDGELVGTAWYVVGTSATESVSVVEVYATE